MAPFLKNPGEEFHQRELARMLKISPATVKAKIAPFTEKKLIQESYRRNALVYSPNLDNREFKRELSKFNIKTLRESGLVEYLESQFISPCIVLFGSWAKGENRKASDIDIFVMAEDKKEINLAKFEKRLGAEIQLFLYSKEQVNKLKKESPELLNNIINGIKLSGFMEVF